MYKVEWCEWNEIINETFVPLIDNKDRYIICKGGRGSSKSDATAKKLIYRCLNESYFRYILIRNVYGTIKDSSYQTIKDIIYDLGLQDLFEFKIQPLEIHCINGNSFLARGCDDTQKLKSIKDPTGAWWEEDVPSENDFITVTTGIRTTKADYLQEIFTINPEVEGNYQDHWFWRRFFENKPIDETFSDVTPLKINEDTTVNLTYTVHHSTYKDNKWIPNEFIAFLMDLKLKNPYYWQVYCNGSWGNRIFGGLFYKSFNVGTNTLNWSYDPNLPLHISFDFNINPYMSLSIWQISGQSAYLIDEIAMKTPNNRTKDTCWEFVRRYNTHIGGLFVYGDPSGKKEDTKTEKGWNEYSIIAQELDKFKPTFRIANSHPPVKTRGDFINSCFDGSFDGLKIYIYEKSVYLKNDLMFGKEASDGTKHKETAKDENGVTSQKYHHFSDNMDYFICEAFADEFSRYQHGDIVHGRSFGGNGFNDRHRM